MADQTLFAAQRRALILEEIRRTGAVRVADLVTEFGVSDMTVRRDLEALTRQGAVQKVHGGAVAAGSASSFEPGFTAKSELEEGTKAALADAAARLVEPGSVVALSAGTTTYAVASRLLEVPQLTVVTNSLRIADLLWAAESDGRETVPSLLLTGGSPTRSAALVGALADQLIRTLHVDLLILGVHGVSEQAGLTTPNLAEAQTNRALIASARRTVVVADHTKWGVVGLSSFAPLTEVDCFITDDALPAAARTALADTVGELVVVPAAS
ncbi:DeoR/GlpR family DNA-binding transcription regulator [Kitasatospora aureofaciens]|uniref:DeoR family transcriptional regulator n=1 Tax=Kitasatospora aureofaciens TaxID=1894 RepID=A0A1E7NAW5_KITAU|nr:DeoR/GlpR family DNA-binding transcription regulator [Kitasatospora aureofaciens]ARF78057.1 DeoR family transcriptional regulator [Kitasatospora aureofaciens]OEV37808.1 DeoR family transcriptional regulator [Kitasatospora aureofaciens]GGV05531.1 DeoR family transcriptional regulator [Kitasatospora aureofaciens]